MYIFGANVIEQLLTRLNMEGVTLENEALVRSLGFIADEMFSHHETGVRQAAKGLLISLHKVVPSEDMFWDLMGKQHQGRNLLTYYIATSERRNVNV
ncbi:hypothetical protein KEM55_005868 [Ascosphaera atra]|nr:hypothetical protein KEM55_005868 [Ascosphaera atra]